MTDAHIRAQIKRLLPRKHCRPTFSLTRSLTHSLFHSLTPPQSAILSELS